MMSAHWTCWLGMVVGAGCLGWGIKGLVLGSVIDDKHREVERLTSKVSMLTKLTNQPPEVRTVEKRVEVPVERVVVKHIEVPVEKIIEKRVEVPIEKTVEKVVDRPVDNPEYLARIKALESEVAMIAGLLPQIAQYQTVASQVGGRSHEGRVLVPLENPEQVARIKALEEEIVVIAGFLAQIAQAQTVASQTAGERRSEERVMVPVDNPEHVARIKALEDEVAVIADLRVQIAELRARSVQADEQVVEKRIETPTDQTRSVQIDQVREHAVDLNHAGAVEQADEGEAGQELPDDLKQIRGVGPALERFLHKRGVFRFRQVATWSQADVEKFEFLLPNFGGRIQRENWVHSAQVEHYKKYRQWLGDGEPTNESPDFHVQSTEIPALSAQVGEEVIERRSESPADRMAVQNGDVSIETISEPAGDLDHARGVERLDEGQAVAESPDDLKQIRGVGPALERFLRKRGVVWFRQVATWSAADIDKFEFLLPNFGGRIQRENWVHSAQVEHYKKYRQWLGDGEPPSEKLERSVQMAESVQTDEQVVGNRIETPAEKMIAQDGDVPIQTISEPAEDLGYAGIGEPSDEGQAAGESPDDLKQIRGVGPGLERFLHKRGVFWFSQVATWSQTDIDKFEFLLPNFSGRIQRENWVYSAQVEYYKKYRQWLGDGPPPSENLDRPDPMADLRTLSLQANRNAIDGQIKTRTETNGEASLDKVSEHAVDLHRTGAVEQLEQ
ncbi:MAG: hypothetical protein OEV01_04680 [Nitrospira sp.]|nr:hypothetical protein [Nitrospira sp.]MDH4303001.1 hypothetical protein [Nitrospira sp.]